MQLFILLIAGSLLAASGCSHLSWPYGQVVPPAETGGVCAPSEVYLDPCYPDPCYSDPCFNNPCYSGEYILMEPDGAYVMPGAPVPTYPPPGAPLAAPTQPQSELPGWFDVLPSGGDPISPDFGLPRGPTVEDRLPNPLVIPIANSELAWDQLADVVSTYFRISREQPVQLADGLLTEGYIETPSQAGATLLEPWRKDSAGAFNRWESTFQTIRRRAYVRVAPTAGGWAIEPQVFKELEDLPYPEHASAGLASLRSDNALPTDRVDPVSLTRESQQWIPLGRDEPLEQKMLREIHDRLTTGR